LITEIGDQNTVRPLSLGKEGDHFRAPLMGASFHQRETSPYPCDIPSRKTAENSAFGQFCGVGVVIFCLSLR